MMIYLGLALSSFIAGWWLGNLSGTVKAHREHSKRLADTAHRLHLERCYKAPSIEKKA